MRPSVPRSRPLRRGAALLGLAALVAPAASAQEPAREPGEQPPEVRAGRFDHGKMWTFEDPPVAWFREAYGLEADEAWFARVRGAALRIPGCSAAFVSPHGLVVTNHHCIRGAIGRLSGPGERLLDEGFYAPTLADERPIPGFWVDQLIAVEDVSDEVLPALDRARGEEERRRARELAMATVRDRVLRAREGEPGLFVQVIPLYQGARYSAYTFRRYTDVRLVAAAELPMGFFGGDADNFTYPRYALDFGFLRVYGDDGRPLPTERFFGWSEEGVEPGDAVFVVGNPGPTNRLSTMAQLAFRRDVLLPAQARVFDARIRALREFLVEDPAAAEALGVRNTVFSLSNSWKQYVGQIEALGDPHILARKRDAERQLRDSIAARPDLRAAYGDVLDRIASLQQEHRALAHWYQAFLVWGSPSFESALLRRAELAAEIAERGGRLSADSLAVLGARLRGIEDLPRGLERRLLEARLRDFATLPAEHAVRREALGGQSPEAAAERLLARSALVSAAGTAEALVRGLERSDPALRVAAAVERERAASLAILGGIQDREAELGAALGRARFAIHGTAVPPEGSSSPRITDGVVRGYAVNGTLAPAYTTFYGLYDRHHAHAGQVDWSLPERWLPPPPGLDLETPLNFVSTADTYGGNSGSPVVTPDLALVGLNFDRTIEGMTRNFIYLEERGRNVMVDVRAIREALDDVYDADRIVAEVLTHELHETEAAADAAAAR